MKWFESYYTCRVHTPGVKRALSASTNIACSDLRDPFYISCFLLKRGEMECSELSSKCHHSAAEGQPRPFEPIVRQLVFLDIIIHATHVSIHASVSTLSFPSFGKAEKVIFTGMAVIMVFCFRNQAPAIL